MPATAPPKHPFVVTLARPRQTFGSLDEAAARYRAMVDAFRCALHHVVTQEGLATDLGRVEATQHLPVLFVTGTDRLAERIRGMAEVRSVARDVRLPFSTGEKFPA